METLVLWLWIPFVLGAIGVFGLYVTRNNGRQDGPAE